MALKFANFWKVYNFPKVSSNQRSYSYRIWYYDAMDGLVLLLVMHGCKANTKNSNISAYFSPGTYLILEVEDQPGHG
jgi:hypothetical protein